MTKLKYQIYILTLVALWGCSQGAVEKAPPVTIPPSSAGESDAARLINQATVSCSKTEDCNASTGMLLLAADDAPHGCTASLVAPDILMTSAQCLYPLQISTASDCSGKIWVKFPAMGNLAAETEECSTVLKTTPYNDAENNQIDYAFLKLKSASHRRPIAMSFDGFQDQQTLSLYKFDFSLTNNQITGVMGRETCRSIQNSVLLPEFTQSESPLVSVAECEVDTGNTGAPLLDDRGRVRGVIEQTKTSPYQSQLQPYLLTNQYAAVSVATNLACMTSHDALPGHQADPQCGVNLPAADAPPEFTALETVLAPQLDIQKKILEPQIAKAALSPHVQWAEGDIETTSLLLSADETAWGAYGVLGISPIPVCILNMDSWIQDYSEGLFGMKKSVDEPITLPVTIFRVGLNQDEAPDLVSEGTTNINATLHFNPQEVLHHRVGTFEIHSRAQGGPNQGQDEILFTGLLKECAVGPSSQ